MAYRIDHSGCNLPPPDQELIEKMARAGREAAVHQHVISAPNEPGITEEWCEIARIMYAALARQAGARFTPIKEPT